MTLDIPTKRDRSVACVLSSEGSVRVGLVGQKAEAKVPWDAMSSRHHSRADVGTADGSSVLQTLGPQEPPPRLLLYA